MDPDRHAHRRVPRSGQEVAIDHHEDDGARRGLRDRVRRTLTEALADGGGPVSGRFLCGRSHDLLQDASAVIELGRAVFGFLGPATTRDALPER